MDEILLIDSDANTLEKYLKKWRNFYLVCDFKLLPKELQIGNSINNIGYKIGLQKFNHRNYKSGEMNYELSKTFKSCWGKLMSYGQQLNLQLRNKVIYFKPYQVIMP